jgi:DNA-binding NtrC family response regulator
MNLPYVLLVENASEIRNTMALMLKDDFRVVGVRDGVGALAPLHAAPRPDLMITDVHLHPGEHGLGLAAMAAELEVPVLLITGDIVLAEQLEVSRCGVLHKPFGREALIRVAKREVSRAQDNRLQLQAYLGSMLKKQAAQPGAQLFQQFAIRAAA